MGLDLTSVNLTFISLDKLYHSSKLRILSVESRVFLLMYFYFVLFIYNSRIYPLVISNKQEWLYRNLIVIAKNHAGENI